MRKLNSSYRRHIIFTLHFAGSAEMFNSPVPITWSETFWYVNSFIPKKIVPDGFPRQVTEHRLLTPFVDIEPTRVSNPGHGK